ncbi:OsmC family protein [Aggregatilinea lenta]|uniref:OsmC family protein n=1 Tax=Aggregatilinea lenta TaxID=913108 RepID=UPI000E5B284B|nr:OsmC family protein [Aggregatilinea lenta]
MITISARVDNQHNQHDIVLQTNANTHSITIPPRSTGFGSSANGGELLFLALATCYCNDLYREAAKRGITVRAVHVEVSGGFDEAPGAEAENVTYRARVEAEASEAEILDLMRHTDTVAEVHNTLRTARGVTLAATEAVPVSAEA